MIAVFIAGIVISILAYYINDYFYSLELFSKNNYFTFAFPVIEEILKYLLLIFIFKKNYIGFMTDGAIYGFLIGSGFAFSENIYYYLNIEDTNLMLNIIRGFGTAIMHGCTVSFAGILLVFLTDMYKMKKTISILLAIIPSFVIHSFYNAFLLPPIVQSVIILMIFAIITDYIFKLSEKRILNWINSELDEEIQIIHLFEQGKFSESNIGKYLSKIYEKFDTLVLYDMINLIKINLELSMQLKVRMMLTMNELPIIDDDDLNFKLTEIKRIEKFIGKSALMAINPIINRHSRDIWKLKQLM